MVQVANFFNIKFLLTCKMQLMVSITCPCTGMIGWQRRVFDPGIFCGQWVLMDLVSIGLHMIGMSIRFMVEYCCGYVNFCLACVEHILMAPYHKYITPFYIKFYVICGHLSTVKYK